MKRKGKHKRKPDNERLTGRDHRVVRHARVLGLWILIEGTRADPLYRFYDRKTGTVLGYWCPVTGRSAFGGDAAVMTEQGAFRAACDRRKQLHEKTP